MPDKLLSLAAYFSRHAGDRAGSGSGDLPPRPDGTVIWVRVQDVAQLDALDDLLTRLQVDGDPIHFVITTELGDVGSIQTPTGRTAIQAFLAHWQPDLSLWIGPKLDVVTLHDLSQLGVPCILTGATQDTIRSGGQTWMPGLMRGMLRQFSMIMAIDDDAVHTLIRAGVDPSRLEVLGPLERAPAALPHSEDERQDIAKTLGARPIWFAADTTLAEIPQIAKAHHQASRRAHRLLLIVSLRAPQDGIAAANILREAGFSVALRSADDNTDDATQVYVADTDGELGLWYRVAPITYLGGSLSGGHSRDPFEAATLGSAVLHGPDVRPFDTQIARLSAVNACVALTSFPDLGRTVETLLSPDKAAQIVHAAWDVTSRGADVTDRLAEIIFDALDGVET